MFSEPIRKGVFVSVLLVVMMDEGVGPNCSCSMVTSDSPGLP